MNNIKNKQDNNPNKNGQKPEKSVIDIVVDDINKEVESKDSIKKSKVAKIAEMAEAAEAIEEAKVVEVVEESKVVEAIKVEIPKPEPVDPIEKYRKEIVGLNDKYTRLYAEYENYKKRAIKEREDLIKYRAEPIATEILQVLDHLELALAHVSPNTDETLSKGVEMTTRELKKILDKFGLSEIDANGKPFDPNFHDAMSMVERADLDNNTVIDVFRKGYTFKDRLIRAASVSVSKKPVIVENKSDKTNQEEDLSS